MKQKLRRKDKAPLKLTDAEKRVMNLVSKGLGHKTVADELNLSTYTVDKHLSNVYAKLGVHKDSEASYRYLQFKHGFCDL